MTNRGRLTVLVLLGVSVAGVLIYRARFSEPTYHGRRSSAWLKDFDAPIEEGLFASFDAMPVEAVTAIRAMGTNTLAWLLGMLRTTDSLPKRKVMEIADEQSVLRVKFTPAAVIQRRATFAFAALGGKAAPAIPDLAKLLTNEPTADPAAAALGYIGPDALPVLTNALAHPNPQIRQCCLYGMGQVGTNGGEAVPALISALRDPNADTAICAALALGAVRQHADVAVPALIDGLRSANGRLRASSAIALGAYGHDAKSATPALLECLVDPQMSAQGAIHVALSRIGADTNLILSTLIEGLKSTNRNVCRSAIWALGGYGERASNATPALRLCLDDPDFGIRDLATNAVVKIAPEFARQQGWRPQEPRRGRRR